MLLIVDESIQYFNFKITNRQDFAYKSATEHLPLHKIKMNDGMV